MTERIKHFKLYIKYIFCGSYLFHILIEENQLLGSVCSKELINQTELEASEINDLKIEHRLVENRGTVISGFEVLEADCGVTLSSERRASSTSCSPRGPASTSLLIKYLCRASSAARLSSFMALACFAISLLASLDKSTILLPDTWGETSL